MFEAVSSLRPAERRSTWIAFAFLTCLIGSHALLETARDALFLARLPPTRLPFMYLAIAVFSLAAARVEARLMRAFSPRSALVLWTSVATVGTLGLRWLVIHSSHHGLWAAESGLYAMYIWSGLIATMVSIRFWSLLGDALSLTQAKRMYPLIGAGSALGALLGSALVSGLSRMITTDRLLLVAAAGFGLSALIAGLLSSQRLGSWAEPVTPRTLVPAVPQADLALDLNPMTAVRGNEGLERWLRDTRWVAGRPYVRRVAWAIMSSAASLTLVDYLFKSSVAANVPASELASFLGGVALTLNLASMISQLVLAPWLLKRFDLGIALAVLPTLLLLGAAGWGLGLGLGVALFLKGADGSLRYSLHRTATELLYLPLPDGVRSRVKAVLDVVVQRVGQVLASLLILAAAASGVSTRLLAVLLLVLCAIWVGSALGLRRFYVELLRSALRDGPRPGQAFPQLDLASLETLITALDSQNDDEVLAALDVLEREGRAHLVPALILHHPSDVVVEHALSVFARARRSNVIKVVDRLLEHPAIRIRCAAVAARSLLEPDVQLLYLRLSLEESPEVRATIVVHLIAAREIVAAEAEDRLREFIERGHASTRVALADAIAWRESHDFDHVLVQLLAAKEVEVRLATIAAMARHASPTYLPSLLIALGDERTRGAAQHALVSYGEAGFKAVSAAARDRSLSRMVRCELPRALAQFEAQTAVDDLLALLTEESDGILRYRILRALEALLTKNPGVSLDRAALDQVIHATVRRAYQHLDARLTLEHGAHADPARHTPGYELLLHVLRSKEDNARDRLLRLLGLAHRATDFAHVRRALRRSSNKLRASSVELVGNLLTQPLRGAVLGLIDDLPDALRMASAAPFYRTVRREYEELLEQMLGSESESLQDFAAYHIGELRLTRFEPVIAAMAAASPGRPDVTRTLTLLANGRVDEVDKGLAVC